jgi:hypothetical protein
MKFRLFHLLIIFPGFLFIFSLTAQGQIIPVDITWDSLGEGANYKAEISSDSDFIDNYQIKDDLTVPKATFFLKQGLYYIRIQCFNNSNKITPVQTLKKNILITSGIEQINLSSGKKPSTEKEEGDSKGVKYPYYKDKSKPGTNPYYGDSSKSDKKSQTKKYKKKEKDIQDFKIKYPDSDTKYLPVYTKKESPSDSSSDEYESTSIMKSSTEPMADNSESEETTDETGDETGDETDEETGEETGIEENYEDPYDESSEDYDDSGDNNESSEDYDDSGDNIEFSEDYGDDTESSSENGKIVKVGKIYYITSKVKISLTAKDPSGTSLIEYSINDSSFQKYKKPVQFPDEGTYNFKYRAVDKINNIETVKNRVFIVDNTAPSVNHSFSKPEITNESKIYLPPETAMSISAMDNSSGIEAVILQINGDSADISGPIILSPGENNIKYFSSDKVGNSSVPKKISVFVDNISPKLKLKLPKKFQKKEEFFIYNHQQIIRISAKDSHSGIHRIILKINGKQSIYFDEKIKILLNEFPSQKEITLKCHTEDKAGNLSEKSQVNFIIDDIPPKSTITIN